MALIALDIDGTTVHHDGSLSDVVRDEVRRVVRDGHTVVLATGRAVFGTLPIARELGLSGYAVCSNGAVLVELDPDLPDGFRLLKTVTFDPTPVVEALEDTWHDALFAIEDPAVGFRLSAPFPEGDLDGRNRVVSREELVAEETTRVAFRSPSASAEEFVEHVEAIGLDGVSYAIGFTAWLDVHPDGVSKAAGLEEVRHWLGVEAADTVAVGDQRNDLEMLRWAARGVAMGQAPPEVQDAADEVTLGVDEDGLAVVLRSL